MEINPTSRKECTVAKKKDSRSVRGPSALRKTLQAPFRFLYWIGTKIRAVTDGVTTGILLLLLVIVLTLPLIFVFGPVGAITVGALGGFSVVWVIWHAFTGHLRERQTQSHHDRLVLEGNTILLDHLCSDAKGGTKGRIISLKEEVETTVDTIHESLEERTRWLRTTERVQAIALLVVFCLLLTGI